MHGKPPTVADEEQVEAVLDKVDIAGDPFTEGYTLPKAR